MKKFKVEFAEAARKDLTFLGKTTAARIVKKIEYFLCQDDPISFAKRLTTNKPLFRWRVGDYRIIFRVDPDGTLILLTVLRISHRKNVYEDF